MIDLLLFLKHNLSFFWGFIEKINGLLFKLLFKKKFNNNLSEVFSRYNLEDFIFKPLDKGDMELLKDLIKRQPVEDLAYFRPHEFDDRSLIRVFNNPAFLMMGAFKGKVMVGYFFLRCFINKKCFVGRLVDREYRGMGIGKAMNDIMYNIAWQNGFRCLSTISRNNKTVMAAHAGNKNMIILKELNNDYLLVEFVKADEKDKR